MGVRTMREPGAAPRPRLDLERYERARQAIIKQHLDTCFSADERKRGVNGLTELFAGRINTRAA